MSDARTPTLQEVIRAAVDARLVDMRVSMPGKIESYDAAKQTAEVTPLLMVPRVQSDASFAAVALQKIPGVPVVFPGGGGARITFPVAKDDYCVLLFADRSLDTWKAKGGGPVDPAVDGPGHALPDAMAFVGLRPQASPLANAPTDRVSLGYDSGPRVELTSSEIDLGHGASDALIKGNAFMSALDTLLTAIATNVGTSGTPAGATAAGAAIAAAQTVFDATASSFLSALVKTA